MLTYFCGPHILGVTPILSWMLKYDVNLGIFGFAMLGKPL